MPGYYARGYGAPGTISDDKEDCYTTLEAARRDALAGAKEVIADALRKGVPLAEAMDRSMEILDADGRVIETINYAEAAEADLRG